MQWDDISYLKSGTHRQRQAYEILTRLDIFQRLAGFDPVLVGTIPLDVDTPDSDLDIICQVDSRRNFEEVIQEVFSQYYDFSIRRVEVNRLPVTICNFSHSAVSLEICGQSRPVKEQNAYRHLVAEARLLKLDGEPAKSAIRLLKTKGIKTEPAFAERFCLSGNPYSTLLTLAEATDLELRQLIDRARSIRDSCIFCQIISQKEEASCVYGDKYTLAFMGLRQGNPGHVLVIPRRHVEMIYDLDDELASHVSRAVVKVAQAVRSTLKPSGLNIWQSNGEVAGQEIFHVHFHIFPRCPDDGYFNVYRDIPKPESRSNLEALAEKLRNSIETDTSCWKE